MSEELIDFSSGDMMWQFSGTGVRALRRQRSKDLKCRLQLVKETAR